MEVVNRMLVNGRGPAEAAWFVGFSLVLKTVKLFFHRISTGNAQASMCKLFVLGRDNSTHPSVIPPCKLRERSHISQNHDWHRNFQLHEYPALQLGSPLTSFLVTTDSCWVVRIRQARTSEDAAPAFYLRSLAGGFSLECVE